MPTEMLSGDEQSLTAESRRVTPAARADAPGVADQRYAERVRRLKWSVAAWGVWTIVVTTLWVTHEWNANGAFQSFGHEGETGQWNPTLWAVGVGAVTLVVGIMALAVHFVRPTADRAVLRMQQLKFHVAAWLFGMAMLTPLWALIEWQDNGSFERWSTNSQPGNWDPWILVIAGVWALAVLGLLAIRLLSDRLRHVR